jgi:hypothetical protein
MGVRFDLRPAKHFTCILADDTAHLIRLVELAVPLERALVPTTPR